MNVKIRKMIIEDYEGMYQLWINTPGMGLNNLDDSREGIEKYLKRNPETCFVAEENGKIVGILLSGHDGRRGYIYHTAVAVEKRKLGIGKRLVNHSIEALEKEGIHKAVLVAFSNNELGNTFWEGNGFHVRTDLTYRNRSIRDIIRIDT